MCVCAQPNAYLGVLLVHRRARGLSQSGTAGLELALQLAAVLVHTTGQRLPKLGPFLRRGHQALEGGEQGVEARLRHCGVTEAAQQPLYVLGGQGEQRGAAASGTLSGRRRLLLGLGLGL